MCGKTDDNQRVERGLYVCDDHNDAFNADVNAAKNIRLDINDESNSESSFKDRCTGWLAQPSVSLYDLSCRFQPQTEMVDCRPYTDGHISSRHRSGRDCRYPPSAVPGFGCRSSKFEPDVRFAFCVGDAVRTGAPPGETFSIQCWIVANSVRDPSRSDFPVAARPIHGGERRRDPGGSGRPTRPHASAIRTTG